MDTNIISDTILVNRATTNVMSSSGDSYYINRVLGVLDIASLVDGKVKRDRKQWKWQVLDVEDNSHVLELVLANTDGKIKYLLDGEPITFIAEVYKHEGNDTQVRTLNYAHNKSVYQFYLTLGYCLLVIVSLTMGAMIAVVKDALGDDVSKAVMLIVAMAQAGLIVVIYCYMIKFIMQADRMRDKYKAWENTHK